MTPYWQGFCLGASFCIAAFFAGRINGRNQIMKFLAPFLDQTKLDLEKIQLRTEMAVIMAAQIQRRLKL